MAFDIDKYKKFHEKRIQGRDPKFIRLEDGDNKLRLLPATEEDGMFFFEYFQHYIDGQYIVCPKRTESINTACPICDYVSKLYATKREDDRQLAGEIRSKVKYLYNAIDRNKEDEGVKILQTGIKLFEVLIDKVCDPDIGDITNIKEGFDIIIKKKQQAGFPNYDGSDVARKPSLLSDNIEKIKEWMGSRYDLSKEVEVLTKDELKAILDGDSVNISSQADEIEKEIEKEVSVQVEETKKEEKKETSKPSDDLMAELEEFMN